MAWVVYRNEYWHDSFECQFFRRYAFNVCHLIGMVTNQVYMVIAWEKFWGVDISRRTKSRIGCIYKKKPRVSTDKPINVNSRTIEEAAINGSSKTEGREGSLKIGTQKDPNISSILIKWSWKCHYTLISTYCCSAKTNHIKFNERQHQKHMKLKKKNISSKK